MCLFTRQRHRSLAIWLRLSLRDLSKGLPVCRLFESLHSSQPGGMMCYPDTICISLDDFKFLVCRGEISSLTSFSATLNASCYSFCWLVDLLARNFLWIAALTLSTKIQNNDPIQVQNYIFGCSKCLLWLNYISVSLAVVTLLIVTSDTFAGSCTTAQSKSHLYRPNSMSTWVLNNFNSISTRIVGVRSSSSYNPMSCICALRGSPQQPVWVQVRR